MGFKLRIRDSFSELKRGVAYPKGYHVDNDLEGIEMTSLLALKTDGKVKEISGEISTQPTWVLADGADPTLQPVSVAYDSSMKDQYGGLNLDETVIKKPKFTDMENEPMSPCKDTVVEWHDDVDAHALYYRTIKEKLTGTVEVAGGSLSTVTGTDTAFTTELKVGEYIIADGQVRQVTAIATDTELTVGEDFDGAITAGEDVYVDTMIEKNVWADTSTNAGKFTEVKPTYGTDDNAVGKILTGKQVRLYLY